MRGKESPTFYPVKTEKNPAVTLRFFEMPGKLYPPNLTYYINRSDSARAVAIQAAVAQAVEEYKTWQRTIGRDVNPSQLAAMVMEAGAKRVTVTAPTFAAVAATNVAALTGSATVTYGGLEDD